MALAYGQPQYGQQQIPGQQSVPGQGAMTQVVAESMPMAFFSMLREAFKGGSKHFDKLDKVANAPLYQGFQLFQQMMKSLGGAPGQPGTQAGGPPVGGGFPRATVSGQAGGQKGIPSTGVFPG